MPNLTQTLADALQPEARERIVWDARLRGFGLRIMPSGRKTWVVQYRAGRRQRRMSLGDAGVVHAAEARTKARRLLAEVGLGHDPQGERQRRAAELTVRELVRLYLERQERAGLRPGSLRELTRHLRVKAKALHPLAVGQVDKADIARVVGAVAKDAPVQANRVWASLRGLFAWAMAEGLAQASPVVGTRAPTVERARDRVLTLAELAAIWRAADGGVSSRRASPTQRIKSRRSEQPMEEHDLVTDKSGGCQEDEKVSSAYGTIVRLILLTGCRREEAGGMTAGEVAASGLWTVPAQRSKGGAAIERPLPEVALALLRPWLAGTDAGKSVAATVLGLRGKPFSGWSDGKARLDRRLARARQAAGLPSLAPWTHHDLRRSVATQIGEQGLAPPHVVEALLGHRHERVGSVHGIYNRATYRGEVGKALAAWAAVLVSEAEGSGAVVPLAGQRGDTAVRERAQPSRGLG